MLSVSGGVGIPLAFVTVGLLIGIAFRLRERFRLGEPIAQRGDSTSRRAQGLVALAFGLVMALINRNALPDVARRSFLAWLLAAGVTSLVFMLGSWLVFRWARRRIDEATWRRMSDARSFGEALPPAGSRLRLAFPLLLLVSFFVSLAVYRLSIDHLIF